MKTLPARRHNFVAAALPLVALLAACGGRLSFDAPEPSRIERVNVERVVTALASDEMRGRGAFTDDALRAADFIAGEFRAAGLQPLEGLEGYLQRFTVRTLTPGTASVTLDGVTLDRDRVVVRPGAASFTWTTGDAEVRVVGPADDIQQAATAAFRAGRDVLLVVDPAHAALFARLAASFGRPVRLVGEATAPSVVMVLASAHPEASYEVSAVAQVGEDPLVNVVGMVPGRRSDEIVLFSAHYDHIGIRPAVAGDSIANGANDDASGTTAVVELGRYFASRGTPERTLLFAAFTAEEAGGYGSSYFSTQLDPDQVVAMFNIEMIGKPAVSGPNTAWITGFERSSFGPLLQEAVVGTPYEFYADPYPSQNLFYRSDNATLARLGVPAHSISTTPIDVDRDYHQVSDHVSTLDLDHMTNTIRAIAMGAEKIVSGEATPTRVDPSTVN